MKWLNKLIVVSPLLIIGLVVAGMSAFARVEDPNYVDTGVVTVFDADKDDDICEDTSHVIFVDAAAKLPGNGSPKSPFRRITDALDLARCIRQTEGDLDSAKEPLRIRVAPGEYLGTYSADKLAEDATLEELPLILNIPNLSLSGGTTPKLGQRGRPTGEVIGSETIIAGFDPLVDFNPILAVTDTADGMAGNQTTIEGFTLKSGNTNDDQGGIGIVTLRVEDFIISRNVFEESFEVAIDPRSASGKISTNYIKDSIVGMFIEGPGTVDVDSNRVLADRGGIYFATTVEDFPFSLGVQEEKFSIEPFEVPSVAHLEGSITNNDLSGHTRMNWSFGLRLTLYGFGTVSHITEQSLNYLVKNNTIQNNVIGVSVDAGWSNRNDMTPKGDISVTFKNNDVIGNCRTPMLVSFTRFTAALDQDSSNYAYLQDSTYDLTFAGGDEDVFKGRWIDHPTEDPVDGRELNNVHLENGTRIDPPVSFDPKPCVSD